MAYAHFRPVEKLTDTLFQGGVFLTFFLAVLSPYAVHCAENAGLPVIQAPNFEKPLAAAQSELEKQRLDQALSYARHQAMGLLPALPHMSLGIPGWLTNNFGMMSLGLEDGSAGDDGALRGLSQEFAGLMHAPATDQAQALWLTPGYHHKGFLPLNDAVTLGANLRHSFWDKAVQVNLHPFYGQNWTNSDSYWGSEFTLSFGEPKNPTLLGFGKISLRYDNGQSAIMDHGRGFDMHSELSFDEHFSLNGGVRKNEDASLGNYLLLRWVLVTQ